MHKILGNSAIIVGLALSACSLAPPYQRPPVAIPDGWGGAAAIAGGQVNSQPFWEQLGSEELNRLMKTALAQNLDLEAALHRIEEARAQAKVAGSPLYPTIQASGGASRTYQNPIDTTAAHATGSISYELDLWGKNRNGAAAAGHRADAAAFDHAALRLVIASDVADFYTDVLNLDERIGIAADNLRNAEEVLRIIEARYNAGGVSGLEVSQQKVAVNGFRAALSSLSEQRATDLDALAILLGQAPQSFQPPAELFRSLKLPSASLTPPAALLTARPDIQSVEANLRAANADIGAARAAFFPSLTLGIDSSIAAGFGGPAAAAATLANSVLAPIFTGGRLTGNLEDVTARQKELAAQYRKTVLVSFQEVEDALAALKSNSEQAALARQSVIESQNAYNIAKARFDAGAIDYLNLLETQRSLYQAQDNEMTVKEAQLKAFVQLRKALGA